MRKYRIDKATGKATFAIVQAEDEIASIGMVIGAGWAGARAMTSTSGPGISLMCEFAGLAYYAEVPAVIFDVQRVGPSTGLPTRTAQGDILTTAVLSHGDTKHILLIPASVEECYTMAMEAFDLAERFQTPVFVMMRPRPGHEQLDVRPAFTYPETPIDRGKRLDPPTLARLEASGAATRTSTATASRTAPCRATACPPTSPAAPATTRAGSTASGPMTTSTNMDRLARKFETARAHVPAPEIQDDRRRARSAIIALRHQPLGHRREPRPARATRPASRCAYYRLRAYPFTKDLGRLHRRSRAGLRGRAEPRRADAGADAHGARRPTASAKLRSVLHYNGLPIDARTITDDVLIQEGRKAKAAVHADMVSAGLHAGGE